MGGGGIFNFSQKIGLKSIKNVRFCILHKPMGGLEPPSLPLATLLLLFTLMMKSVDFETRECSRDRGLRLTCVTRG